MSPVPDTGGPASTAPTPGDTAMRHPPRPPARAGAPAGLARAATCCGAATPGTRQTGARTGTRTGPGRGHDRTTWPRSARRAPAPGKPSRHRRGDRSGGTRGRRRVLCGDIRQVRATCAAASRAVSDPWKTRGHRTRPTHVFDLVPEVGLEPTRCCHRGILNPLRLPIPPLGPGVHPVAPCIARRLQRQSRDRGRTGPDRAGAASAGPPGERRRSDGSAGRARLACAARPDARPAPCRGQRSSVEKVSQERMSPV